MMEIKIPLVIRPALKRDLFGSGDTPLGNSIYFLKDKSGKYIGPYRVHSEIDMQWFINAYIFRDLHVLSADGDGYLYQISLRPSDYTDLVDYPLLREHQMYYVKLSSTEIDGPFYIHRDTDVEELRAQLKSKSVYVVGEKQNFEPFKISKSA